jgi:hypothetical protein
MPKEWLVGGVYDNCMAEIVKILSDDSDEAKFLAAEEAAKGCTIPVHVINTDSADLSRFDSLEDLIAHRQAQQAPSRFNIDSVG